jgi:Protein of unknown function (DUF1552)
VKLSAFKNVSRRDLLRGLGASALALPGLELFGRSAHGQTNAKQSKYIVFCYTPDGVNESAFWPSGSATNYTLSPILAPFEKYKDKLLIIGPQMNNNARVANTGLTYRSDTPQHQAPVTLSARTGHSCTGQFCVGTLGLSYLSNQFAAVNKIDGPSIDQVIAQAVGKDLLFSSLNFGVHPVGGDTPSDINFAADGTPLKRLDSADTAWSTVFGTMGAPSPDTGAEPSTLELDKLNAVTDFLHARFSTLRPALGAADRVTLDGHLASLQVLEQRAQKRLADAAAADPTLAAHCTDPVRGVVSGDANSGSDTETLSPFFMDMIATAFSCNITKVASMTFGYPGGGDAGGLRMPWLGFTDPLHFVSHHGNDATKLRKYQQMSTWIAGQIAGLMDRLAALPSATGSGTLLDETTIYWFNRHSDGNAHANSALPNVILGGTGGYFSMGRWLQFPSTNPTQVLISLANSMGVDVPSFGEEAFRATSGLADLT